MDSVTGLSTLHHNTPATFRNNDTTFRQGIHRGKPFIVVCRNHPEFFVWLIQQPAGNVVPYFDYIRFCFDMMSGYSRHNGNGMLLTPE